MSRPRTVRLIYEAEEGLPPYTGPGLSTGIGRWEEELGSFTTDDNAWTIAQNAAEQHLAGWLFHYAGQPVPGFNLATVVGVEGLSHRQPHPNGSYWWQVKGTALMKASGLPDPSTLLTTDLADYRTEEGKIRRVRSTSSRRAGNIAELMAQGVHPRDAILAFRPPPVVAVTSGPASFWPRQ